MKPNKPKPQHWLWFGTALLAMAVMDRCLSGPVGRRLRCGVEIDQYATADSLQVKLRIAILAGEGWRVSNVKQKKRAVQQSGYDAPISSLSSELNSRLSLNCAANEQV